MHIHMFTWYMENDSGHIYVLQERLKFYYPVEETVMLYGSINFIYAIPISSKN